MKKRDIDSLIAIILPLLASFLALLVVLLGVFVL